MGGRPVKGFRADEDVQQIIENWEYGDLTGNVNEAIRQFWGNKSQSTRGPPGEGGKGFSNPTGDPGDSPDFQPAPEQQGAAGAVSGGASEKSRTSNKLGKTSSETQRGPANEETPPPLSGLLQRLTSSSSNGRS